MSGFPKITVVIDNSNITEELDEHMTGWHGVADDVIPEYSAESLDRKHDYYHIAGTAGQDFSYHAHPGPMSGEEKWAESEQARRDQAEVDWHRKPLASAFELAWTTATPEQKIGAIHDTLACAIASIQEARGNLEVCDEKNQVSVEQIEKVGEIANLVAHAAARLLASCPPSLPFEPSE